MIEFGNLLDKSLSGDLLDDVLRGGGAEAIENALQANGGQLVLQIAGLLGEWIWGVDLESYVEIGDL